MKIPRSGKRMLVCRKFYASTVGMSDRTLGNWVNAVRKPKVAPHLSKAPKTGKRRPISEDDQAYLDSFLDKLATVPSHYCRNIPAYHDVKFLDAGTKIRLLYSKYKQRADRNNHRVIALTGFRETMKRKKIRIFRPRKDHCTKCKMYENGNMTKEQWERHRNIVKKANDEKKRDERNASNKNVVWTMDLQAIQLAPKSTANSMYFKTKIGVHNYSFFNKKTKTAKCFFWNETDSDLSSNTFASIQNYHFRDCIEKNPAIKRITIWSDGCNTQTRNCQVAGGFVDLARRTQTTIVQKYLAVGHSMMEVDSMHSCMERATRYKEIHLPEDYERYCREARNEPFPYETKLLDHTDFTKCPIQYLKSIRPGSAAGTETVYDLKAIKYLSSGSIWYKTDFVDQWRRLPQPVSIPDGGVQDWVPLNSEKLPISINKYRDLQQLAEVIPKEKAAFYKNLPFRET